MLDNNPVQARRDDIRRHHACIHLYVVIGGTVQISVLEEAGCRVIIDIYTTDDFFGETSLVGSSNGEQAIALENTMLMSWRNDEIERLIESRPKLGISLLRAMARREIDFVERLENLTRAGMGVRLAKSLIRFSERYGRPLPDGRITMRAFSQEFLADYISTSREMVNITMTEWRRQELVRYSRRELTISKEGLREWIRSNS